ncbi:MAG: PASTA domain-containing protein [Ignavibacteria bacterium]|nr:PASTA domain-containing protein [Ignavibacteria bacterium]
MPNLKGKTLRDAKFSLEQRGLKLGETVRKNTNEFPIDVVISQIIQPGSKLKKNSNLDLILSDGPFAGDLKIPELTGKHLKTRRKLFQTASSSWEKLLIRQTTKFLPDR